MTLSEFGPDGGNAIIGSPSSGPTGRAMSARGAASVLAKPWVDTRGRTPKPQRGALGWMGLESVSG